MDWPDRLNAYEFFLGDRISDGLESRVAIRLDDRTVTYGEIDELTAGFVAAYREAGVGQEDRVLLVMSDGPEFVAALFATFHVGGVVVMMNPGLRVNNATGIIDRARPALAVVGADHLDHFRDSLGSWNPEILEAHTVEPGMHQFAPVDTGPNDAAIWLFSGGTTGVPKAAVQTHKSLVNTTNLYGQGVLRLEPDDITIAVPKLYFGYATGSNLLFPFSVGASIVLFKEHPTPDALLRRIAKHRPTVLVHVPSAINQMLNHPGASEVDVSSLRVATSAGEALPDSLYRRWVETFGVELLDGLGTAEMWHIFISNAPGAVRPGTLGQVVPGFEIKACDDDGNPVSTGEVGRLWVRGDSLGLCYFEEPEKTEEAFQRPWFVGGDLVSIDEEGYVTHRGRADDAIKVKGKWFRPQEVESVLLDHPAVQDCAVVAVADGDGLAQPVAFAVVEPSVDQAELTDWMRARLESYKTPRTVNLLPDMPHTHLGKIDRGALKRMAID